MTDVAVIGLGKMGLPVAAYYAMGGATVVGYDTDRSVVEHVNAGTSLIGPEPGMDEELAGLVASGRLRATTDPRDATCSAEVVIVLVPLLARDGEPDFGAIDAAVASIAPHVQAGALVIFETTVPVGTTRTRFAAALRARQPRSLVAFSPERVYSGRIWSDLERYPKLLGGVDRASSDAAARFYRQFLPVEVRLLATAEAAEMVKLAETTYRDINIAFANELARFADDWNVDVTEVVAAANSQPYSHIHDPGIGVGGHCIPHYPHLLEYSTSGSELIRASRAINEAMPAWVVDRMTAELGGIEGKTVLLRGIAYRGGVKEAASSPAFGARDALEAGGAVVVAEDPVFSSDELVDLGFEPWKGELVDAVVIVTNHEEYQHIDWSGGPRMLVVDGRNCLNPVEVIAGGHAYLGVGRAGEHRGNTDEASESRREIGRR